MIIVTGTKRSGTSLMMQTLRAAGLPWVGEAFSSTWRETIADANPEGFFESRFRTGIHFLTNPDPSTGEYMHPADVREHAVKIFVPGLSRTDLAFVDKVVACVRDVREYCASMSRVAALEDAHRRVARDLRLDDEPHLDWWYENHALLVDALTRRYPLHVVSHERITTDPDRTVVDLLRFVGRGDASAARSAVKPTLRHFDRAGLPPPEGIDAETLATFDALYALMHGRGTLDDALLDRFEETNLALTPRIEARLARREEAEARARSEAQA